MIDVIACSVDIAFPAFLLAIEVDGPNHFMHLEEGQYSQLAQTRAFTSKGSCPAAPTGALAALRSLHALPGALRTHSGLGSCLREPL